jgi:hypothetical protein
MPAVLNGQNGRTLAELAAAIWTRVDRDYALRIGMQNLFHDLGLAPATAPAVPWSSPAAPHRGYRTTRDELARLRRAGLAVK